MHALVLRCMNVPFFRSFLLALGDGLISDKLQSVGPNYIEYCVQEIRVSEIHRYSLCAPERSAATEWTTPLRRRTQFSEPPPLRVWPPDVPKLMGARPPARALLVEHPGEACAMPFFCRVSRFGCGCRRRRSARCACEHWKRDSRGWAHHGWVR